MDKQIPFKKTNRNLERETYYYSYFSCRTCSSQYTQIVGSNRYTKLNSKAPLVWGKMHEKKRK